MLHTLALNLILIVIGYRLAYELRFDFAIPAEHSELFWLSLPLLVVFRFAAYANFGVFRAYWLHFGPQDLLRLALAVTLSSLAFAAVVYLSHVSPACAPIGAPHRVGRRNFSCGWYPPDSSGRARDSGAVHHAPRTPHADHRRTARVPSRFSAKHDEPGSAPLTR